MHYSGSISQFHTLCSIAFPGNNSIPAGEPQRTIPEPSTFIILLIFGGALFLMKWWRSRK